MQPTPHALALAQRSRLADQDEEGCLKDVLGQVLVAQDTPRDAQHHRPVAAHQHLKGGLIPLADEPCQQAAVAAFGAPSAEGAADAAQDLL